MSKLPPSLRKAAVLISALDEPTAEALLAQMSPDDSAKVRRALVELDEIPPHEEQTVLAELLQRHAAPAMATRAEAADVALELDPEVEAAAGNSTAPQPQADKSRDESPPAEPPLKFLRQAAPDLLATALRGEQPQTVAAVIAHLPPAQAAAVLERLPSALATDALERMAWTDEPSPEVLADVAHELRKKLAPQLALGNAESRCLSRLSAVLKAMDGSRRTCVVGQLANRNAALLDRLGLLAAGGPAVKENVVALRYRLESGPGAGPHHSAPPPTRRPASLDALCTFDDLAALSDADLRTVFSAVDPPVVLLALTGADQRLLSRIMWQLPAGDAAIIQRRLENPGPVRLRDIENAQQELAVVASRLAREQAISLPAAVRFAAAI